MTAGVQKILILGGYGTFGRRLAQLLTDDSQLTLVIAGRSLAKAQRLCAELLSVGTVIPAELDRALVAHSQDGEMSRTTIMSVGDS